MGDVKDGGPAFPFEYDSTGFFGEPARNLHTGMTLRDWFAGEALPQAVLDYSNGRGARQRRLAESAMARLSAERSENQSTD